MFCPNCGAQSPDGSVFCAQCGATFTPASTPAQPQAYQQPVPTPQQVRPASQPMPAQPQFGAPQQNPQPMYGQPVPAYGAPQPKPEKVKAPKAPMSAQKKTVITFSCIIAALVAAFLIVLLVVVVPKSGGKGALNHTWKSSNGNIVLDLKGKTYTSSGYSMKISKWDVSNNVLSMSLEFNAAGLLGGLGIRMFGNDDLMTEKYMVALSADGKTLLLFDTSSTPTVKDYNDYPEMVLMRAD